MKRFKNILFVVTRSSGEKASLKRAVALAKQNAARLTIVDTLENLPRRTPKLQSAAGTVSLKELLMRELRQNLQAFSEPAKRQGIQVTAKILRGTPFVEIIREVVHNGRDLVMKTATGKGGLREMLFGTTAMHLFRKCPCPVWLLKPTRRRKYTRILAAVDPVSSHPDRDALTKKILDLATSLAKGEDCELNVAHAWQLPGESVLLRKRTGIDKAEIADILTETRHSHKLEIDCVLHPYRKSGHRPIVHLLKGDPAEQLAGLTQKKHIDLVVMGTVTRTGVAGLLMGSTAERVLQKVDCSVVAVKPDGFISPVT